ncbi:hypothetical protein ACFSX9_13595 [Flavobacterium ardleyense]|uniref:Uncharacterized protein n=1 Tax=Flavobacterium ardleyense TaxID=2038737 RepID=A0ABW5ZBR2_9FLAO
MELFVLIIYIFIILTTIFYNSNEKSHKDGKFHSLLFITVFKVFSPKPIKRNTRIFFRDYYSNKSSSNLFEFMYYERPSIKHALWHFENPKFQLIFWYIKGIEHMILTNAPEEQIFKSRFYRRIEFEVLKLKKNNETIFRQIIFVEHNNSIFEEENTKIYLLKNVQLRK